MSTRSIVLLRGIPEDSFLDVLKRRKVKEVFVLEGRPKLESVRALCKKLLKKGIVPTLITDNMAGFLFYKNLVKEIWVAYQSLEKNGAFCDIGALILGVLGRHHKVPVYIFSSGEKTNFLGSPKDIFQFDGRPVAAKGIKGYVPLVEWLPKRYISEIYR